MPQVPAVWIGGPKDGQVDLVDDKINHVLLNVLGDPRGLYVGSDRDSTVVEDKTIVCDVKQYSSGAALYRLIMYPGATIPTPKTVPLVVTMHNDREHDQMVVDRTRDDAVYRAHKETGSPGVCFHRTTVRYDREDSRYGFNIATVEGTCTPLGADIHKHDLERTFARARHVYEETFEELIKAYIDSLIGPPGTPKLVYDIKNSLAAAGRKLK